MNKVEDTLKDTKAILTRILAFKNGEAELHGNTYINYVLNEIDHRLEELKQEDTWDVLV